MDIEIWQRTCEKLREMDNLVFGTGHEVGFHDKEILERTSCCCKINRGTNEMLAMAVSARQAIIRAVSVSRFRPGSSRYGNRLITQTVTIQCMLENGWSGSGAPKLISMLVYGIERMDAGF